MNRVEDSRMRIPTVARDVQKPAVTLLNKEMNLTHPVRGGKITKKCKDAAKRKQCAAGCEKWNRQDCCYSDCPSDCIEKARWGECPKKCAKFKDDPKCCAPKCPAKCTNKRSALWKISGTSEKCRSEGVPECGGIKGCCPEHYDVLFGAVAFDPDSSREN